MTSGVIENNDKKESRLLMRCNNLAQSSREVIRKYEHDIRKLALLAKKRENEALNKLASAS